MRSRHLHHRHRIEEETCRCPLAGNRTRQPDELISPGVLLLITLLAVVVMVLLQ